MPRLPFAVLSLPRRRTRAAFTLIEALVVIVIVSLLASVCLQVAGAAQRQAHRHRAEAELALLATALQSYRRHYGDFPQRSSGADLWAALRGAAGPNGVLLSGRSFVSASDHTLQEPDPMAASNQLLDPWGQGYRYHYVSRPGGLSSFLLYSSGPDERDRPPDAAGQYDAAHRDNVDNVFAHD